MCSSPNLHPFWVYLGWNLLELRRVPDNIIKINLFPKPLVLFWDKKIVIDGKNAWGRMGVHLRKNNMSIYFFPIYRIYRYMLGIISFDLQSLTETGSQRTSYKLLVYRYKVHKHHVCKLFANHLFAIVHTP